jgi:hypothetical protein
LCLGLLAFIAIIGSFHRGRSAVQEVGAGLVVTHIALAIALLVPMHMKKLSPVDSILGTITLDAQNVALSIQLISKQTLAARWQTYIVIFGQLAGLVAIGVLIQNFAKNHLATDSLVTETCECVSVYWWGWLNNCSTPAGKDHRSIWAYYALRLVTAIHCWVISILKTSPFDKAKRREEASPCEQCAKCRDGETRPGDKRHENCRCDVCVNCNQCNKCNKTYYHCCNDTCSHNDCAQCPRKRKFQDRDGFVGKQKYSQMSASLSLMFFEYSVYALLSLLAAESLLKSYQIQPSSPWSAIGQVTSTVIAVSTALRFLWVFGSLFWKEGVALV